MLISRSKSLLKEMGSWKKMNSTFVRCYSPLNYKSKGRRRILPIAPKPDIQPDHGHDAPLVNNGSNSSDFFGFDPPRPLHEIYPSSNYQAYNVGAKSLIKETDAIFNILSQSTIIIERKIEYMNLFLGFEQANNYKMYDSMGNQIGWLIERDFGIGKAIMRQIYKLHRPFTVDILDIQGNHLLTIRRPFSFINSHIKAILPVNENSGVGLAADDENGIIVGESVQSWHLWRRRYNLFKKDVVDESAGDFTQFGKIDSGFLRWEFPVYNEEGLIHGSVTRDFSGLFREFLTDTGVYVLRMDPKSFEKTDVSEFGEISNQQLSLDEKAVMLANAVSIDFDYFSRHSGPGGGIFFFGGGGDDI